MLWLEAVALTQLFYILDFVTITRVRDWAMLGQSDREDTPCLWPLMLAIGFISARKHIRLAHVETWLWPADVVSHPTDRCLLDTKQLPSGDDSYVVYVLKACNNLYQLFGLEIVLVATAVVAFIRLNVYGLLYIVWIPFLVPNTTIRWKNMFVVIGVLLPIQYLFAVGLPPSECYPYIRASQDLLDRLYRAGLRWLYVSPIRVDPNTSCLAADPAYVIVDNAPTSWQDPTAIFADMVLLLLISMQIGTLKRMRREEKDSGGGEDSATARTPDVNDDDVPLIGNFRVKMCTCPAACSWQPYFVSSRFVGVPRAHCIWE